MLDESSSFEVMDAAVDAGINHFDTADVYGGPQTADMAKGYGVSEEVIGRWLQRSGRRDEIVLATKVYQPMGLGPNDRRLSAYHLRRACEASLRRLQTDHIDLYQMHHVDRATPWEEIWQAMEQLVREGKVTYVGSSNFAAWDVALAQSAANARHFLGLTSEQCLYNLAKRGVEMELVPALRSLGVGLIAYSPLHAGLLAGALEAVDTGAASDDLQQRVQPVRGQLETYEALCREIGAKPADVALAWLLRDPVVSTALVGARSVEQLQRQPRWPGAAPRAGRSAEARPHLARSRRSATGIRLVRVSRAFSAKQATPATDVATCRQDPGSRSASVDASYQRSTRSARKVFHGIRVPSGSSNRKRTAPECLSSSSQVV